MQNFSATSMVLGAAAALGITLGTASAETFRMSHNTSDTTTWQKGAERFAELVEEKTGGEHSVRIFPNAQLTGATR